MIVKSGKTRADFEQRLEMYSNNDVEKEGELRIQHHFSLFFMFGMCTIISDAKASNGYLAMCIVCTFVWQCLALLIWN